MCACPAPPCHPRCVFWPGHPHCGRLSTPIIVAGAPMGVCVSSSLCWTGSSQTSIPSRDSRSHKTALFSALVGASFPDIRGLCCAGPALLRGAGARDHRPLPPWWPHTSPSSLLRVQHGRLAPLSFLSEAETPGIHGGRTLNALLLNRMILLAEASLFSSASILWTVVKKSLCRPLCTCADCGAFSPHNSCSFLTVPC